MRKLAREAVIFMLLGAVLSGLGTFIFETYTRSDAITTQRRELKKQCDSVGTETTPLIAGKCIGAFGQISGQLLADDFVSSKLTGDRLDEYNKGKDYGLWLKTQRVNYFENSYLALIFAGIGFITGFVLWLLYRLVRFTVEG